MSKFANHVRHRLDAIVPGFVLLGLLNACGDPGIDDREAPAASTGSVVLYTSLPHERILAVADAYREATGVVVNFLIDPAPELIDSLAEKRHSPSADVLLIDDVGPLSRAVEQDVLRPVDIDFPDGVSAAAPADPDGYWFGVGYSVDAIIAGPGTDLAGRNYASLAGADFAGRLCLRRGASERSRGLVATMLAATQVRDTELAVRGWRNNLARGAYEEEADLVRAVADGDCSLAVAATDQVARYVAATPGSELTVHLPALAGGGAVVHPLAAGVARHAGDSEAAKAFVGWLLSADGQAVLHEGSGMFPVNGDSVLETPLSEWAGFAISPIGASAAGFVYADALELMERARYQ